MYSLVNNEMNGSKKNEIIEVQNRIDGHKYNHNSVMTKKKLKQNNDDDDKGKN